jgi:transposase
MLADFYGRILVEPTTVEHTRGGFEGAVAALRSAVKTHDIADLVVAVEQTDVYHQPVKHAFADEGFETRIVHPLTTKQFRIPADPGNKTDDTDLLAIHRATVNGFGLTEPKLDSVYAEFRLLARHRRDLVVKNAAIRNQIHVQLDSVFPGLSAALGNIFDHEPAMVIARQLGSAQEIHDLGLAGIAKLLDAQKVRYHRRSLAKILLWAEQAHENAGCIQVHKTIFLSLDDERRTRLGSIQALERELAGYLAQTPYVLLLSFAGINVVSAAEFAAEMGPIENYATDGAITGRAGIFPSRYQSDKVDRCDGPLVRRANHALRFVIFLIADNLLLCNSYFRGLWERWRADGLDHRLMCVRTAKRFSRIAYQMVAGRQVFRHPSCQERHMILEKLSRFHLEHKTSPEQILRDLKAATCWIPTSEYPMEAEPLKSGSGLCTKAPAARAAGGASKQRLSRRQTGLRQLSEILPEVLARLGVTMVESSVKGEIDLT